jgi:hypothetical protein
MGCSGGNIILTSRLYQLSGVVGCQRQAMKLGFNFGGIDFLADSNF